MGALKIYKFQMRNVERLWTGTWAKTERWVKKEGGRGKQGVGRMGMGPCEGG